MLWIVTMGATISSEIKSSILLFAVKKNYSVICCEFIEISNTAIYLHHDLTY